jgi:hypothetical protein
MARRQPENHRISLQHQGYGVRLTFDHNNRTIAATTSVRPSMFSDQHGAVDG